MIKFLYTGVDWANGGCETRWQVYYVDHRGKRYIHEVSYSSGTGRNSSLYDFVDF
jgi:hypothetical protein